MYYFDFTSLGLSICNWFYTSSCTMPHGTLQVLNCKWDMYLLCLLNLSLQSFESNVLTKIEKKNVDALAIAVLDQ